MKYPEYQLKFDENSVDAAHLNWEKYKNYDANQTITLSHDLLLKYCQLCHFQIFKQNKNRVLFGIRGAQLIDTDQKNLWKPHLSIKTILPDHRHLSCVMGIWDIQTQTVCAYQGSTVPNAHWVNAQQNSAQRVANLLGQGLHSYYVGPHEPDPTCPHEGAWRLNECIDIGVWRLRDQSEGYALNCEFEAGHPNDNIHSAYPDKHADAGLKFSSAGCQVISGNHQPPLLPVGDYQSFRVMAGQAEIPEPASSMIFYDYLLIPSVSLHVLLHHQFNEIRLMQGSTGVEVRKVQDQLRYLGFLTEGGFNKGYYNGKTAHAVYCFQKAHQLLADAIIKPNVLETLDLAVLAIQTQKATV